MNLPNKITISRIILIPFVIFFYLSSSFIFAGKLIAGLLFVVGILTDYLDGHLARKNNQITLLGTFLDSIADKMFVIAGLVLIVVDGTIANPFGVIALVIVISRELIVSALRQLGAGKNVIISADMWGKVKATVQFFAIFLFMIFSFFIDNPAILGTTLNTIFSVVCYLSLFVTVVCTVLSGVHYLLKYKEVFKEN
ncbi:MAG: CDP-diacylglycerol--glycerol-3-phosphate 3-phosphatidyltransferase [Clostridia bacterium]|nr:CDP-diacylglycerol--glycerol-3-phosphate 3-phosphatidyltransferase [Clostridia bacterium]